MTTAPTQPDLALMRRALALAASALGTTWPNPAVGCVLAHGDASVAEAATGRGGRPHAEEEALRHAGAAARGSTAYVTLEPCAHQGRGPPCAQALVAGGVSRVVIACPHDPDPRVGGRGIALLQAAGIEVTTGLLGDEACRLNEGFFTRVREGRPFVTLKLATSLDGRIATATGESRWVTGEAARGRVQALRACHDAVMVGSGTVLADDPSLLCRMPGREDRPSVRVIADGRLRTPATAQLIRSAARRPTWIVTRPGGEASSLWGLPGVTLIACQADPAGTPEATAMMRCLAERGLTRVLVEGGGRLAASLLAADLVDELVWHRAPLILGGEGRPAVAALPLERLAAVTRWRCMAREPAGDNLLETYRPAGR